MPDPYETAKRKYAGFHRALRGDDKPQFMEMVEKTRALLPTDSAQMDEVELFLLAVLLEQEKELEEMKRKRKG